MSTFILDNEPSDISGPLADFQHTVLEKEDFRKLIGEINYQLKMINEKPLTQQRLNTAFERYWKDFEGPALDIKSSKEEKEEKEEIKRTKRKKEGILEEILDRLRKIGSVQNSSEFIGPQLLNVLSFENWALKNKLLPSESKADLLKQSEKRLSIEVRTLEIMKNLGACKATISREKNKIAELSKIYND